MTAKCFVDSNVFLYALDTTERDKQQACANWLGELWRTRSGRISFQVLQEVYVNATAKLSLPLSAADAQTTVQELFAWRPAAHGEQSLREAWRLQERYRLSWWDALIVATARLQDCEYLISEDLQHGQDLDGTVVLSPFRTTPAEILKETRL